MKKGGIEVVLYNGEFETSTLLAIILEIL